MSQYKVNADELVDLARKIYDEACHGYLDLKNSICDKMVREFLDGRAIVNEQVQITTPPYYGGSDVGAGYSITVDPPGQVSQIQYQTTTISNAGDISLPYHYHDGETVHIQTVSGHTIEFRDNQDSVRVDDPQMSENIIRRDDPRLNFDGNESERF